MTPVDVAASTAVVLGIAVGLVWEWRGEVGGEKGGELGALESGAPRGDAAAVANGENK